MLHKCANKDCLNLFRSMSRGKLFQVEQPARARLTTMRKHSSLPRLEYFWLCDDCSLFFTLTFVEGQALVAVPLRKKMAGQISGKESSVQKPSGAGGSACSAS
jgi:hypothetical protein